MPAMRRQPERLVFIDETSVKTNLTRLRGRAPRGERLQMEAPLGNWGTQTFIAGLTAEGLIAPWVIIESTMRPIVCRYVEKPDGLPGRCPTADLGDLVLERDLTRGQPAFSTAS